MTRKFRVVYSAIVCLTMALAGIYLVHYAQREWDMLFAVLLLIVSCFALCMAYINPPKDRYVHIKDYERLMVHYCDQRDELVRTQDELITMSGKRRSMIEDCNRFRKALCDISHMETAGGNATVRRMAQTAKDAIEAIPTSQG